MITISDLLIAPYEVDVDKNNFTLVKVKSSTNKKGEETTVRKPIGYYSTLGGVLGRIIRELVQARVAQSDLDGQIVDLKEFLKEYKATAAKVKKFYEYLDEAITITSEDIPTITPEQVIDKAKEKTKTSKKK